MERRGEGLLRLSFLIGGVADALAAANWLLIAAGVEIPNYLCGLVGSGGDYRFAMYIAALFMAGWSALLFWGWFRPFERRWLLLITAILLAVSIAAELGFYRALLPAPGLAVGIALRLALIAKFTTSFLYSRTAHG